MDFIGAKDDEMEMTAGAIRRANLQSNYHHQQTNTQFFTGRMPFLSPNQQCQNTEWRITFVILVLKMSLTLAQSESPGIRSVKQAGLCGSDQCRHLKSP